MDPGGISVARTLPIDGALLGDVLLRLRRDSAASVLRWTLGDRGSAEVDVSFTSAGPSWTTTARLWNHTGLAVTAATLALVATGADEVLPHARADPAPRPRLGTRGPAPRRRGPGRARRARRRAALARDARGPHAK